MVLPGRDVILVKKTRLMQSLRRAGAIAYSYMLFIRSFTRTVFQMS